MPGIEDYDEWGGFYLSPGGTIIPTNPSTHEETINNNAYGLLIQEVRTAGYDRPVPVYTEEQQRQVVTYVGQNQRATWQRFLDLAADRESYRQVRNYVEQENMTWNPPPEGQVGATTELQLFPELPALDEEVPNLNPGPIITSAVPEVAPLEDLPKGAFDLAPELYLRESEGSTHGSPAKEP